MKKLHRIFMFLVWIAMGISLISLSAQAVVCMENQNTGALMSVTYAGITKQVGAGTCKQWDYVSGGYMLLDPMGGGTNHTTRQLNDLERVIVGGTTIWNYDWDIKSLQCKAGICGK